MGRKGGKRTSEIVTRLVDLGSAAIVEEFSVSHVRAQAVMRELAHNLAREFGGGQPYWPKDSEFGLTKRDLQIYEETRSGNAAEVGRKHGLSERQVYAINKFVRDQIMRKRQNPLPGFEEQT